MGLQEGLTEAQGFPTGPLLAQLLLFRVLAVFYSLSDGFVQRAELWAARDTEQCTCTSTHSVADPLFTFCFSVPNSLCGLYHPRRNGPREGSLRPGTFEAGVLVTQNLAKGEGTDPGLPFLGAWAVLLPLGYLHQLRLSRKGDPSPPWWQLPPLPTLPCTSNFTSLSHMGFVAPVAWQDH